MSNLNAETNDIIQEKITGFIYKNIEHLRKELKAQEQKKREGRNFNLQATVTYCRLNQDSSWHVRLVTEDTSKLRLKENLVEKNKKLSGIITSIRSNSEFTLLSINSEPFQCMGNYNFIKKQYKDYLMLKSLYQLANQKVFPENSAQAKLRNILLGLEQPTSTDIKDISNLNNSLLNEKQKQAVLESIKQNEICIIHGPPGTGKTTTLVEIIEQEISKGGRVMVCASANVAVDNLMDKVIKKQQVTRKSSLVRIGHPGKITKETLIPNSLFYLTNTSPPDDRKDVLLQSVAIFGTLSACNFYLNTQHKTSLSLLPNNFFTLTVIDEASQSLETNCWSVIPYSKKLILAGDPCQLPPTIMTTNIQTKKYLSISLMERMMNNANIERNIVVLYMQYRMNAKIMDWPSKTFYQNKLIAAPRIANKQLASLEGVKPSDLTQAELILANTESSTEKKDKGKSLYNEAELAKAVEVIEQLIINGVRTSDIAIISPYAIQTKLLKELTSQRWSQLEISTIDAYQGSEKEVIILSTVRSNKEGRLGFLKDPQRMNVAITRAKKQFILIANAETLGREKQWASFLQSFEFKLIS